MAAPLGKTLVLALTPDAEVAIPLENEWVRQLRDRGVEANAVNALLPGNHLPDEKSVVELVRAGGYTTLLVSRLLSVKKLEREVSAYQVAVVETTLYDSKAEQRFWSARSDTFLVSPTGDRVRHPRSESIRDFVETMIREMSNSKVF